MNPLELLAREWWGPLPARPKCTATSCFTRIFPCGPVILQLLEPGFSTDARINLMSSSFIVSCASAVIHSSDVGSVSRL